MSSRFQTGTLVARGGMGEVYKCWEPEAERYVALKLLHRDDPVVAERFLREARAQARLEHPNICEVYETGELDGRPFIAMRWVDGLPLDKAFAGRPVEEVARVAAQVAEALQAAHEVGLIHRDLKPANILVEESDEGLVPYVLDFGVARLREIDGLTTGLTRTGEVIGTPGYMSPEQARGEVSSLDRRSDIFAFGCTLFEALSGQRAFQGETAVEILMGVIERTPPALRSVAPQAPRDLEVIVERCLEKEREDRYASARAVAEDLQRFLRGEPIEARPVSRVRKARRWLAKNPVLAGVAAAGLIAALVLVGAARRERVMGQRVAELARQYGQEAERHRAALRFESLAPLHDTASARDQLEARLRELEGEVERGRAAGAGYLALAQGYLSLGEFERARRAAESARQAGLRSAESAWALARALNGLYRQGLEEARAIASDDFRAAFVGDLVSRTRDPALELMAQIDPSRLSNGGLLEADVAFLEDRLEDAEDGARAVLSADPLSYEAYRLLGDVANRRADQARSAGDLAASLAELESAAEAYQEGLAVARSDPETHQALCATRGTVLELAYFGAAEPASQHLALVDRDCERAARVDSGSSEPWAVRSGAHLIWARVLEDSGEDPFPSLDRAADLAGEGLGIDAEDPTLHLQAGNAWTFRAGFERTRGLDFATSTDRAVASLERATELAPDDARAFNALGLLGWELIDQADEAGEDVIPPIDSAIAAFRRATELLPSHAKAHSNLATMHKYRAIIRTERGLPPDEDFEVALASYKRAIEADPTFTIAYNNLGDTFVWMGRAQRERGEDPTPALEQALQYLEDAAERNPDWSFPLLNQGMAHHELARWARDLEQDPQAHVRAAVEAFDRGLAIRSNLAAAHVEVAKVHLTAARSAVERHASPDAALDAAERAIAAARAIDASLPGGVLLEGEVALLRVANPAGRGSVDPQWLERVREAAEGLGAAEGWMLLAELELLGARKAAVAERDGLDRAVGALDRVDELRPRWAEAALLRGEVLAELARLGADSGREAQLALERAVELKPTLASRASVLSRRFNIEESHGG